MKKLRWTLVGLMIVQPLVIYFAQSALLVTVPVHYGFWGADAWNRPKQSGCAMRECRIPISSIWVELLATESTCGWTVVGATNTDEFISMELPGRRLSFDWAIRRVPNY